MKIVLPKLLTRIHALKESEDGQDLIEYALTCGLVGLALVGSVSGVASGVTNVVSNISHSVSNTQTTNSTSQSTSSGGTQSGTTSGDHWDSWHGDRH